MSRDGASEGGAVVLDVAQLARSAAMCRGYSMFTNMEQPLTRSHGADQQQETAPD